VTYRNSDEAQFALNKQQYSTLFHDYRNYSIKRSLHQTTAIFTRPNYKCVICCLL